MAFGTQGGMMMTRTAFERTTPESLGIRSQAIEHLLDTLESGFVEPHGLMIMRYGKVCAEGWWSPYAPGIRHSLQSLTKTYASTAVGIACTEKLLRLDDKIADLFKDEMPENPSENLLKMTVHDVLCMGCGMDKMSGPSGDWIRDFLATEVNHVPGTVFMYNSTGSSFLGAIVRKLTGLGLHDYLKPRLFDKIGIDADNLRWLHMPDGLEVGGGGLYATTEDNLRLMKLYADGGICDGERILAEEFVKRATSKQIDTTSEQKVSPEMPDHFVGYGYQIWRCQPEGVYRADGAMGQFSIVSPDKHMVISITQNADGAAETQRTLDAIWDLIGDVSEDALLEDKASSGRLASRMNRLALPNPVYSPYSETAGKINGTKFVVTEGALTWDNPFMAMMGGNRKTSGIEAFTFRFGSHECELVYLQDNEQKSLNVALDGSRAHNRITLHNAPISHVLVCGAWTDDNAFVLSMRWIETYYEYKYEFRFDNDAATVFSNNSSMAGKQSQRVLAVRG
jgi:CubicO group peptidase (beta-lactamase class C family)